MYIVIKWFPNNCFSLPVAYIKQKLMLIILLHVFGKRKKMPQ